MAVNGQIFGGPRDGQWVQSEKPILKLVDRVCDTTYVITYRIDRHRPRSPRWVEIYREEVSP